MNTLKIRPLWDLALENFGKTERQSLPPADEELAWMIMYYIAKKLLRFFRHTHGRIPKPPGLDQMKEIAAAHFENPKERPK